MAEYRIASRPFLGFLVFVNSAQSIPPPEPVRRAATDGSAVHAVFEGFVLDANGALAEGAVVVSSAGGKAVTDVAGSYRLEVDVPRDAASVQVTATGNAGGNMVASASVALVGTRGRIRVDPLQLATGSSCSPSWEPTFGWLPGVEGAIQALTVYDDGGGPALYAGGGFGDAGGVTANGIAKWDGASWSALGSGVIGYVTALAAFDDGGGPALYAGGHFLTAGGVAARGIAKWDGSSWSVLGTGTNGDIEALMVYDDGSGPALYAGGDFTTAGGVAANRIARWDGSSWSALGIGLGGRVSTLTVYDDGGGPALYSGGSFLTAGGVTASRIAKWDGSTWSALGSGVSGGVGSVLALTVYDDGGGPALYAGGYFTTAGGERANRIAKWDGSSWSSLGSGLRGTLPGMNLSVQSLAVHDDGHGPALYACGDFQTAGSVAANSIAKWDGSSWSALGSGLRFFGFALHEYDAGNGPALYAGGSFTSAGGVVAYGIARWDGSNWSALGSGLSIGVQALAVHDDGSGSALYAGGSFLTAGDVTTNGIAKWDGTRWAALSSGMAFSIAPQEVDALTVFDDGGGPALYAGGAFTSAGGVAANHIAKWNGTSWSALGSGMSRDFSGHPPVVALAVFDDGGGAALYAGGYFLTAGGTAAKGIAKWDGSSWSALGSGLDAFPYVEALTVYDDGGGRALYAGGHFTLAGGVAASRVAKWDGSRWSALGSGIGANFGSGVHVGALTVYDDGGGPALYAGGLFTIAGGVAATNIAKWDGSSWAPLGSGIGVGSVHFVSALSAYDDGSGPALYAGGFFTSAGGVAANRIARWDGSRWSPLGSGVSSLVSALAVFDGPERGGPALLAGGDFGRAFDSGDSYLARWQGCPDVTPPVLSCPESVTVHDPRPGPPGEIVTFAVTASDDRDPTPSVVCVPPSGSLFPPGVTLVVCKASDRALNQSSCSFLVNVIRMKGQ